MHDLTSIPIIKYDNFLKSKYITWSKVGGRIENYPESSFGDSLICFFDNIICRFIFSFRFFDNKIWLVLKYDPREYKIKKGNSVSFLFENDTLLNFMFTTDPYKAGEYYERISGKSYNYFETLAPISLNDLDIFSKYRLNNYSLNLSDYKLIGGDRNKGAFWMAKSIYETDDDLYNKETFQKALMLFAETFIKTIKEHVPEYVEQKNKAINDSCYLYLMLDTATNYYKIGISNSPEYREKTLQSEKPSIVLIASKSFPKRKIAEVLEKTLHEFYSNKRIRGEWFYLDIEDVKDISLLLNS